MVFQGLKISIETDRGELRHWHDPHTGRDGTTKMRHPYGYIRLTEGKDGDHVDCYIGPNPNAAMAYVVHQLKAPTFSVVDEDKVMLGFDSLRAAKRAYLAHYDDPRFLGEVSVIPMGRFKDRALATRTRKDKIIKGGNGRPKTRKFSPEPRRWLDEIEAMYEERKDRTLMINPRGIVDPLKFDRETEVSEESADPWAHLSTDADPMDMHPWRELEREHEAGRERVTKDTIKEARDELKRWRDDE